METIAARLAKVRADNNLSVRAFAEMLVFAGYEVSRSSVGSYEREDHSIPAEYVAVVARVFNRNPAWLLLGEEPEEKPVYLTTEQEMSEVREMMQRIQMLAARFTDGQPGGGDT